MPLNFETPVATQYFAVTQHLTSTRIKGSLNGFHVNISHVDAENRTWCGEEKKKSKPVGLEFPLVLSRSQFYIEIHTTKSKFHLQISPSMVEWPITKRLEFVLFNIE